MSVQELIKKEADILLKDMPKTTPLSVFLG